MKKIIILAAMLAMMLVAAAPAFAEATGGDFTLTSVDASQSVDVSVTQTQTGDALATSGDLASAADASVSNSADISVEQINGGFVPMDGFDFVLFF